MNIPTPDKETEAKLLAACLNSYDDRERIEQIMDYGITDACFFSRQHKAIFAACYQTYLRGQEVDIIDVEEVLSKPPHVELFPNEAGHAYPVRVRLNEIAECTGITSTWQAWAKRLIDIRQQRELASAIMGVEQHFAEGDIAEVYESLQTIVDGQRSTDHHDECFADIAALIAGGIERPLPDIAPYDYSDDGFLLYSQKVNEVHGEPSVGKTNIACAFVLSVLRQGQHVLYIDPEDTASGILARLLSFGAEPAMLCEFFHYAEFDPDHWPAYYMLAKKYDVQLIVIDGLAELFAAHGLDENIPADTLNLFRKIRQFRKCNAAVLISDHVSKDKDKRGAWARGSGAKMGRYDGVSYAVSLGKAYTPKHAGFVRLQIAKDRNGGIGPKGMEVAEISFQPDELIPERTLISIQKSQEGDQQKDADRWLPTKIMEKIINYLKANPDANKRDLRTLGRGTYVDQGIDELVKDGRIILHKDGKYGAIRYEIIEDKNDE